MLLTVSEFRQRVLGSNIDRLLDELADLTGRNTAEERAAWTESFTRFAHALDSKALAPIQLYLGELGSLSLEYRLPASASWCDLVFLGHDGAYPNAVIVELKHWDTRRDAALPYAGLIDRPKGLTLHPAEQVKGYAEYCRHFHSEIQEMSAVVNGCVVFTRYPVNPVYTVGPNQPLTSEYQCFSLATAREASETIAFLNQRLAKPDEAFAKRFERGHYKQNRSFIKAVGETLRGSPVRRLELLDEQREGLCVALAAVRQAVSEHQRTTKKRVVIIEGPPGSGKSAIAAKLWAELATDSGLPSGDLAFVTTSQAQNHNLEHLFGAGRGAVKKATSFSPSTTHELGRLKKRFAGQFENVDRWRENFSLLRKVKGSIEPEDDSYLVSVVDEAHALINPEYTDARGQFGFPVAFGPLAYHIIRASVVSVFLLDEQQGFRERETTTKASIIEWAKELGAEVMPEVSLKERQFRCGGSIEYIAWLDGLVRGNLASELANLAAGWRAGPGEAPADAPAHKVAENPTAEVIPFPGRSRRFRFEMVDYLQELDETLLAHNREGDSVRLVSSYAREWITEKVARPHEMPAMLQDFHFKWTDKHGERSWSRIWNWRDAPEGYVSWVDPSPGVPMARNPLAEVGCPYTVRGFDYDYLGVLWLKDVVWKHGGWRVLPQNVFEVGLSRHTQRAENESDPIGPKHQELLRKLLQGYRILLSRALKGVYVWCEDPETRAHLEKSIYDGR